MPANRLPTSPAVGRFLQEQRKRLGYTLRDVQRLSGEMGKVIPFSTLARIEQGTLDPGLPRLHQLLRTYHVPLQAAGDLLDLEESTGAPPAETDPHRLYRLGHEAAGRGDPRGALAAFLAARRHDGGEDRLFRQKILLSISSFAATLGKNAFAKHVIDGLLLEGPEPGILVTVLVQASRCWQWLGGAEAALAFCERAERHLTAATPAHQRAFLFHQLASLHVGSREFDAAERHVVRALAAYRDAKDPAGYCRCLGVRVRTAFVREAPEAALAAARTTRAYAQRNGLSQIRLLFLIQEARAHLALGDVPRCLAVLGTTLADAVGHDDRVVLFYTHYYFWRAYETLGDAHRARAEFETAVRHVEFLDEVTDESTHVRALLAHGKRSRSSKPA